MLEIEDRRIAKVKIYGVELSLKRPTFGEISKMQKSVDGKSQIEAAETVASILVSCGLPQETLDTMIAEDVLQLFEHLTSGKKK